MKNLYDHVLVLYIFNVLNVRYFGYIQVEVELHIEMIVKYMSYKEKNDIEIVHMTQYNQMTKVSWLCHSGLKLSRMYKEYSKFVKSIAMWLIEYSKL
jgi:hypothetical protein